MTDALPSPANCQAEPRLPIEVCERVIEAVYDDYYELVSTSLATLSNCALVCRAWRPRAQRVLFEFVLLRDKDALYRFAQLLDASPELGNYVRTLELRGHIHVPYSPAVLFLAALRGRLTNLAALFISGFDDAEKAANPLPEGEKELPFLPIHRYFPSLLTSISHSIRTLNFSELRFPSFGDFARFLSTLPNLKELACYRISWAVLGLEPVCMAKRSSHDSRKMFLPNLALLECYDMDELGRQRLLSALGPSLQQLVIKFPNDPPAVRIEYPRLGVEQEAPSLALNIRSFPCLDSLGCVLMPFPQPDQTLESLRDTLVSWVPSNDDVLGDLSPSQRCLNFVPGDRSQFKREDYVALLRIIGPVVEAALCRKETAEGDLQDQISGDTDDRPETDPCRAGLVVNDLGDRLEWEDWWRQAVAECFPTLSRWKRLYVFHGGNPGETWRDHDLTPQDYAERLQAMADLAEARRRRRRSTRDVVKKFLPSRGILMHVRQKRKRYYQPTCLRRTRSRSSSSLRGRTQSVLKTRIYSVSTFNVL